MIGWWQNYKKLMLRLHEKRQQKRMLNALEMDLTLPILQLREAEEKEKQAAEPQQKAELLAQQVNIF